MTDKQRRWFYRTRDPEFLWKLGICIVLAGFALAWAADGLAYLTGYRSNEKNAEQAYAAAMQESLTSGNKVELWVALNNLAKADYEDFLQELANYDLPASTRGSGLFTEDNSEEMDAEGRRKQAEEVRGHLEKLEISPEPKELALLFWDARAELDPDELTASDGPQAKELKQRAEAAEAPRFVNWALALYAHQKNDVYTRNAALEREGRRFPEAKISRELLIESLSEDDPENLARLVNDPVFADVVQPHVRLMVAVHQKDWLTVWKLVPVSTYEQFDLASAVLALTSGIVWLTILLRSVHTPRLIHRRTGLAVLAIALGVLSVWPTLWAVYWQEYGWKLTETPDDLLQNLKFFIAGVGLREELSKLLLFLPLGIFLARDGDGPEILALAGCVGLGFAMEENISYFSNGLSAVTIGRFLTANVMHITMTGISGKALCRALRNPAAIGDFLGTFTLMVLAHGLYDALGDTAGLEDYGFLSLVIMIGLAYYYFHTMSGLLNRENRMIYSLSSIFVGGLALIFSCTLVVLAFQYSALMASVSMYFGALDSALLIVVFLRQFKEVRV